MAENESTTTQDQANSEVKQPVSLGKVQRVQMVIPQDNNTQSGSIENVVVDQQAIQNNEGAGTTANTDQTITEEKLKEYFKGQGIDYNGLDSLKEKLTAPVKTEETPEEKEAKIQAREKRLLDKFVSGGGKIEEFVAIKGIATSDATLFSINMAKADLMKGGYTAEEAEVYIKENLGQIDDAELEQNDDETDKEYKKRVKEFNAKLLAANSNPHIEKAKWVLQNLNEAIDSEDLQVKNELTISANIDEQFKTLNRKDTFEIGEINGKAIPPIESEVPEEEVVAISKLLKDPDQRKQYFQNPDGSQNHTKLTELLIENAKLKAAMKVSYHEGSTRTNAAWEKVFPARSAQELGVGGSQQRPNNTKPGTPASFGKNQRVQPQRV